MHPVLGGEIVKGKENIFVLYEAFAGLGKFLSVEGEEAVIGNERLFSRRRQM